MARWLELSASTALAQVGPWALGVHACAVWANKKLQTKLATLNYDYSSGLNGTPSPL